MLCFSSFFFFAIVVKNNIIIMIMIIIIIIIWQQVKTKTKFPFTYGLLFVIISISTSCSAIRIKWYSFYLLFPNLRNCQQLRSNVLIVVCRKRAFKPFWITLSLNKMGETYGQLRRISIDSPCVSQTSCSSFFEPS